MSSAWLLPEHIADVLPVQARQVEDIRRALVEVARGYGFELVIPPLLEHVESLLAGASDALERRTFMLTDQLSGRALGLRSDSTLQVARIDAHLLNRAGVVRLCYCGPVLQTLPEGLHASREPLQFGAELYGHAGLEADLEVQDLVLDCLRRAGISGVMLDLGDARLVRAALAGVVASPEHLGEIYAALAAKDAASLRELASGFPADARGALQTLVTLYGDAEILAVARRALPQRAAIGEALDALDWLARRVRRAHPEVEIGFDLADIGTSGYYSGPRFAAYAPASPDALARGGRYDEVGAAFGRNRAAVGFSLDVKSLAAIAATPPLPAAIRAPWTEDAPLRDEVRALRAGGETVVQVLPGHESEADAFACDRELAFDGGRWRVRALDARA